MPIFLILAAAAAVMLALKSESPAPPTPPKPPPPKPPPPSQYSTELAAATGYLTNAKDAKAAGDQAVDTQADIAIGHYQNAAQYAAYGTAHAAAAATLADRARHSPGSATKAAIAQQSDRAARQEQTNAESAATVGAAQQAAMNAVADLQMALDAAKTAPTA